MDFILLTLRKDDQINNFTGNQKVLRIILENVFANKGG